MQFLINAEQDTLPAMATALAAAGIEFDAHTDLISIHHEYDSGDHLSFHVSHGYDLRELTEAANKYLTGISVSPLLPDPTGMTTFQRNSLLELLNTQFAWRSTNQVNCPWGQLQTQHTWYEILEQRPEIFEAPDLPAGTPFHLPASDRLLGPTPTAVLSSAMATHHERTTGETESPGTFCDAASKLLSHDLRISGKVALAMQNWDMPQPLLEVIWEETDQVASQLLESMSQQDRDKLTAAVG